MNKTNNLWNRIAPISPISIYQVICSFELFSLPCECVYFFWFFLSHISVNAMHMRWMLSLFFQMFNVDIRLFWNWASFAMVHSNRFIRTRLFSLSFFSKLFIKIYLFHDNFFFFSFVFAVFRLWTIPKPYALPCNDVCIYMMCQLRRQWICEIGSLIIK